jgi:hypothetical protein
LIAVVRSAALLLPSQPQGQLLQFRHQACAGREAGAAMQAA